MDLELCSNLVSIFVKYLSIDTVVCKLVDNENPV